MQKETVLLHNQREFSYLAECISKVNEQMPLKMQYNTKLHFQQIYSSDA